MRIYTRTGDDGKTSLLTGERVSKHALRLHAYGTIDELNAVLGLVIASRVSEDLRRSVVRAQSALFIVGGDLAAPRQSTVKNIERVSNEMVAELEREIDAWQARLPELRNFILPGGGMAGAFLHQARTVCRRAERWIVQLANDEDVSEATLHYVNRLSDWLFVAARVANMEEGYGDTVWAP